MSQNNTKLQYAQLDAIMAYAEKRGCTEVVGGWAGDIDGWWLQGRGRANTGRGLLATICMELGIFNEESQGAVWIKSPERAVYPEGPVLSEYDKNLAERIKATVEAAESTRAKQQRLLDELVWAMEVLPSVAENLDAAPVEVLEPFAQRIVLATMILQSIESRVFEQRSEIANNAEDTEEVDESAKDELIALGSRIEVSA